MKCRLCCLLLSNLCGARLNLETVKNGYCLNCLRESRSHLRLIVTETVETVGDDEKIYRLQIFVKNFKLLNARDGGDGISPAQDRKAGLEPHNRGQFRSRSNCLPEDSTEQGV